MKLRLYIAGNGPNSLRACANLKKICATYYADVVDVEIVDVWDEPRRALTDGVLATPTLLRVSPEPHVLILGDLSATERVVDALGGYEDGQEGQVSGE